MPLYPLVICNAGWLVVGRLLVRRFGEARAGPRFLVADDWDASQLGWNATNRLGVVIF